MISYKQWMEEVGKQPRYRIHRSGWFLFGFIPLVLMDDQSRRDKGDL